MTATTAPSPRRAAREQTSRGAELSPAVGRLGGAVRDLRRAGVDVEDLPRLVDRLAKAVHANHIDERVATSSDPTPGRRATRGSGGRPWTGAVRHGTGGGDPGRVPMSAPRCTRATVGLFVLQARRAIGQGEVAEARGALLTALECVGREREQEPGLLPF